MSTILIVNDDRYSLKMLGIIIKRALKDAYELKTFISSEEALSWFKKNKKDVGLIITDYKMPRLNGYDFLLSCYKTRKVPSIMSSAYIGVEAYKGLVSNGICNATVSMPVFKKGEPYLIEKITELIC